MTTLKEFSKQYLQPVEAYLSGNQPVWRRDFPTKLRTVDREVVLKKATFWSGEIVAKHKQVQEYWVRIHSGEIIDEEWRDLYAY